MKSKQTRIVLLQPIGPHEVGASIEINPMLAAKLIAQGKAEIEAEKPKAKEATIEPPKEPKADPKPKAEKPKAAKK